MQFDQNGWLDEAIEIDYLNKSMDRQGHKITHLVIHGTAGGTSAQAIANMFATSPEDASAHFIIGTDGTTVQGIPCSLAAWANGPIDGTPADNLGFRTESDGVHRDSWWSDSLNPNFVTVSIEHCKASTGNSDSLTPAQQDASFKLVQCICDTYNIPKRFADANGGITGHFSVSAINRQHCPGNYPWNALWAYLNNGGTMNTTTTIQVPGGWADDPTNKILKAPNGVPVVLGFRDHVLASNWSADNWPISVEHAANPVEQSHPALGVGTVQNFRWKRLEYTAQGGIIEAWLGQELEWYEQQYAALQAQIVALKQQPNVANLLAIHTLASQIVQKSQVQ